MPTTAATPSNPTPSHTPSLTSVLTTSDIRDEELQSPAVSPTDMSAMTDSADSILSKLTVSPQTIPEGKTVEHSIEPLLSPTSDERSPISRHSSTRSTRMSASRRIPNARRTSRRSTSANNTSVSPAQAFLSSWAKEAGANENVPEPQPDDKGQEFGLHTKWVIGETINRGGFGVVKEAHTIDEHGNRVLKAVKIVRKTVPGKNERENEKAQQELEHEVSVWRDLGHRHVLKLIEVYDTDFATFCVMDLNVGGTLFDVVSKARRGAADNDGRKGLQPKIAKSYAYQLACALRYLHEDIRVCHRDVKLENCLVDVSAPNAATEGGNLRLCDFGLADFLNNDQSFDDGVPERFNGSGYLSLPDGVAMPTTSSIIGTLEYASPKGLSVHRKLFETAGDVWAFGVVVYALCTGELPFRHPMPSKTVELIMHAEWDINALRHAAAGGDVVIELVKGCLEKDIDLRLTIGEALRSGWFEGCRDEDEDAAGGVWL